MIYALHDAEGRILAVGVASDMDTINLQRPLAPLLMMIPAGAKVDDARCYIADPLSDAPSVAARPALTPPAAALTGVPALLTLPGLPTGTAVKIDGAADTAPGGDYTATLTTDGAFAVSADPPFPAIGYALTVKVSPEVSP